MTIDKTKIIEEANRAAMEAWDRLCRFLARTEPVFGDQYLSVRLLYCLDDGLDSIRQHGPTLDLLSSLATDIVLLCAVKRQEAVKRGWLEPLKPDPEIPSASPDLGPIGVQLPRCRNTMVKVPTAEAPPLEPLAPGEGTVDEPTNPISIYEIAKAWSVPPDTARWRMRNCGVNPLSYAMAGHALYHRADVKRVADLYTPEAKAARARMRRAPPKAQEATPKMMEPAKPLPCECGAGEPTLPESRTGGYWLECRACGRETGYSGTAQGARDEWDERHGQAPAQEPVSTAQEDAPTKPSALPPTVVKRKSAQAPKAEPAPVPDTTPAPPPPAPEATLPVGLTVDQIAAETGLGIMQVRTLARRSILDIIPGTLPPQYTRQSVETLKVVYRKRGAQVPKPVASSGESA